MTAMLTMTCRCFPPIRMSRSCFSANGPVFDGMLDDGGHLVVDALLEAMVNMDA